jgi:ATP-dependent Lon protease
VARSVASEQPYQKKINQERVEQILGAPIFDNEIYTDNETAGVVTGLAWTQTGGEILFIESSLHKGKGRLTLSGQLGEVMKESAGAALSYLKAHASDIKLDYRVFDQYDLHIHVPAGAVPKDGPSAGITMLTSIASAYTQRKVKSHLAMTGEITLTGKVLPVGGIKEKLLAARRAGIKELILCRKNRKDVEEIAERYKNGLVVHFVDNVREVLELSLLPTKVNKPLVFELDDVPPQTAKPL